MSDLTLNAPVQYYGRAYKGESFTKDFRANGIFMATEADERFYAGTLAGSQGVLPVKILRSDWDAWCVQREQLRRRVTKREHQQAKRRVIEKQEVQRACGEWSTHALLRHRPDYLELRSELRKCEVRFDFEPTRDLADRMAVIRQQLTTMEATMFPVEVT